MKRYFAAGILAWSVSTACALAAATAPPISVAQFKKLQKFLDTVGVKESFPPPTAESLGFSADPTKVLRVVEIATSDNVIYFCRSQSNRNDYVVWVRGPQNESSYMFSTHPDLKPVRALYLRAGAFPQLADVNSAQVKGVFDRALATLAADIDRSSLKRKPASGR